MLRRILVAHCAVSALSFTSLAHAQTDAPAPPAPAQPTPPAPAEPAPPAPSAPAEPAPPPAAPTPPAETPAAPPPSAAPPAAPPPSATPPSAATPTAPPSGSFPLPPDEPKKPTHPPRRPKPEPAPEPEPSTLPPESPRAREAAAPPAASQAIADKPTEIPSESPKEEDDVDQFKIGPVAGLGIPSIISFGGTLKLTRFLGAGVNVGLIPKVQLNYYGKATLSYQHYDIYGRLYPFGGGFFLQGGAGYATVSGTMHASQTYSAGMLPVPLPVTSGTATYDGNGSVRTLMLTALLGYFYTTSVGFSFGIDGGIQLPIAPSKVDFNSSAHTQPPQFETLPQFPQFKKDADDQVRDTLEKIGRTPLPTVNLRIGWIL